MRRALFAFVATLALLASTAAAAPPPISAPAYVVRVGPEQEIIAARAPDAHRAQASITKLMTVLVALEQARLDDLVTITPAVSSVGESSVGLRVGEQLTVGDLAIAALVPSANDAATALALHVGNGSVSRFVELMNAKAKALGLTATRFENPHGLDQKGHFSSARDATTLLGAALRNSFIRTWSSRSTATIAGGRTLTSTNLLIGTLPLVWAKTGHTENAGWSQVAAVEENGVRVTASLLGAASESRRNAELASLLTWGLGQYRQVAVTGDHVYGHAEVGYGRRPIPLVAARDVVRSVRIGRPLVERVVASTALSLPVTKGQRVGEVRVFSDGTLIARTPLVAAASSPAVGAAGKVEWYARRTMHHVFGLVS